jgi:hypothetical protein
MIGTYEYVHGGRKVSETLEYKEDHERHRQNAVVTRRTGLTGDSLIRTGGQPTELVASVRRLLRAGFEEKAAA